MELLKEETVKKKAPKKFTNKSSAVQHCIDDVLVDEVLKNIPNNIKILGCRIRFGMPLKRTKAVVPNKLRKLGVNYLNKIHEAFEAEITLDQVSKAHIKRCVKGSA
jgi:hypothetical protein